MRDAQGFDEFYRATSVRMVRYGYALMGDLADAQDVVQEAYTRAWRQWPTVAGHPTPEGWVRLTVSRLATDRWRRLRSWRAALSRAGPPPDESPPSENTVLLTTALRQLPPDQRQAVALHYLFDLSVDDIARESGVPAGTVKSWLYRGRARLAELLAEAASDRMEVSDAR